jgi:hypothetical protein
VISEDALVSIGLNDRLCGAIGVISVAGTSGLTIHPPALMLYAVLPLGVATIRPVVTSIYDVLQYELHSNMRTIAIYTDNAVQRLVAYRSAN